MSATARLRTGLARECRVRARDWWPLASKQGIVGLSLLTLVLGIALIGPLFAPHSISQPIGIPGAGPSAAAPLGTDFLGRDVLSRVLNGGLPVLELSLAAIIPTYIIGMSIGLAAGLSRTLLDPVLMRLVDLVLCLPPLLLLLVLLAGAGTGTGVLVAGIVIVLVPGVARLVRTATLEVATSGYVEAAVARGETRTAIARREILPNISPSVLADFGVRFSAAVTLGASVNFLGLGAKPPAANWGLMIAENRLILPTNVWSVLVPALLLAALAVSVNLLADAFEHSRQRRSA
jgi:peptide/nickel transport system permease protein